MDEKVEITWHDHLVSREMREEKGGHRGCVVWFTGLSGCGKSTIANRLDHQLFVQGVRSYVLDGDNVRHGLNASAKILEQSYSSDFAERFGLGFGEQDRVENIRRIGEVARLLCDAGLVVLAAFVSPYREDRNRIRSILNKGDFIEVFVDTPLDVCESRDPKGLYKKARAGEITGFTGIDAPYEAPENPEMVLRAGSQDPDSLTRQVFSFLIDQGKIPSN